MYKVYALINPIDENVIYIGATKGALSSRLGRHMFESRRENFTRKHKAINEILKAGHRVIIEELDRCEDYEEALKLEEKYIEIYTSEYLTNIILGGRGTNNLVVPESTRLLISKGLKGNTNWLGKTHTDESREKISNTRKANFANMTNEERKSYRDNNKGFSGHTHTPEARLRISIANTGRTPSEETREKLRNSKLGLVLSDNTKNKIGEANSKKVYQYELIRTDNEFSINLVKEWDSVRQAAKSNRIFREDSISNVCRGKTLTHGGYYWSYFLLTDEEREYVFTKVFKPNVLYVYRLEYHTIKPHILILIGAFKNVEEFVNIYPKYNIKSLRAAIRRNPPKGFDRYWSRGKKLKIKDNE